MRGALIAGIVGAVVISLLLAGSIVALVMQRRRGGKARRADEEHAMDIVLPKTAEQARAGVRTNTMQNKMERRVFGN